MKTSSIAPSFSCFSKWSASTNSSKWRLSLTRKWGMVSMWFTAKSKVLLHHSGSVGQLASHQRWFAQLLQVLVDGCWQHQHLESLVETIPSQAASLAQWAWQCDEVPNTFALMALSRITNQLTSLWYLLHPLGSPPHPGTVSAVWRFSIAPVVERVQEKTGKRALPKWPWAVKRLRRSAKRQTYQSRAGRKRVSELGSIK